MEDSEWEKNAGIDSEQAQELSLLDRLSAAENRLRADGYTKGEWGVWSRPEGDPDDKEAALWCAEGALEKAGFVRQENGAWKPPPLAAEAQSPEEENPRPVTEAEFITKLRAAREHMQVQQNRAEWAENRLFNSGWTRLDHNDEWVPPTENAEWRDRATKAESILTGRGWLYEPVQNKWLPPDDEILAAGPTQLHLEQVEMVRDEWHMRANSAEGQLLADGYTKSDERYKWDPPATVSERDERLRRAENLLRRLGYLEGPDGTWEAGVGSENTHEFANAVAALQRLGYTTTDDGEWEPGPDAMEDPVRVMRLEERARRAERGLKLAKWTMLSDGTWVPPITSIEGEGVLRNKIARLEDSAEDSSGETSRLRGALRAVCRTFGQDFS